MAATSKVAEGPSEPPQLTATSLHSYMGLLVDEMRGLCMESRHQNRRIDQVAILIKWHSG